MPLLLAFFCLVFLLLFALTAGFFTVDVLFHEVLPNEGVATIIAAVSGLVLVMAAIITARKRESGRARVLVFLAVGFVLLLLQPILQTLGRSYTRASLDAAWAELRSGLKIANMADELIVTASGRPIGLRLSFDLTLGRAGTFQFFPHAKSEDAVPHFLEPARFERDPVPPPGQDKNRFEAGRSYRLSYDLVPTLLAWDRDKGIYCLRYPGTQEFVRMANADSAPASMKIELGSVLFAGSNQSFHFEADSQADYYIKAIGETGLTEDFSLCGSNVSQHLL